MAVGSIVSVGVGVPVAVGVGLCKAAVGEGVSVMVGVGLWKVAVGVGVKRGVTVGVRVHSAVETGSVWLGSAVVGWLDAVWEAVALRVGDGLAHRARDCKTTNPRQ